MGRALSALICWSSHLGVDVVVVGEVCSAGAAAVHARRLDIGEEGNPHLLARWKSTRRVWPQAGVGLLTLSLQESRANLQASRSRGEGSALKREADSSHLLSWGGFSLLALLPGAGFCLWREQRERRLKARRARRSKRSHQARADRTNCPRRRHPAFESCTGRDGTHGHAT
jgi:hypothetical protein